MKKIFSIIFILYLPIVSYAWNNIAVRNIDFNDIVNNSYNTDKILNLNFGKLYQQGEKTIEVSFFLDKSTVTHDNTKYYVIEQLDICEDNFLLKEGDCPLEKKNNFKIQWIDKNNKFEKSQILHITFKPKIEGLIKAQLVINFFKEVHKKLYNNNKDKNFKKEECQFIINLEGTVITKAERIPNFCPSNKTNINHIVRDTIPLRIPYELIDEVLSIEEYRKHNTDSIFNFRIIKQNKNSNNFFTNCNDFSQIEITFSPSKEGVFRDTIPLYLKKGKEEEKNIVIKIPVYGTGINYNLSTVTKKLPKGRFYKYTGDFIIPEITLEKKYNIIDNNFSQRDKTIKKTLWLKDDYEISYYNNKNIGEASMVITPQNFYNGENDTLAFFILAENTNCTIDLPIQEYTYTGKPITPMPILTIKNDTLKYDYEYTVEYENNINAGIASIFIIPNFSGHCSDSNIVKFKINPAKIEIEFTEVLKSYSYTGLAIKPSFSVSTKGFELSEKDYIMTYLNNIEVGIGSVTCTPTGNFTGDSKTFYFKIEEKGIFSEVFQTSNEIKKDSSKSVSVNTNPQIIYDDSKISFYKMDGYEIAIYDIVGTVCTQFIINNNDNFVYHTKNLSKGIYLLRAVKQEKILNKEFFLQ